MREETKEASHNSLSTVHAYTPVHSVSSLVSAKILT
jgi:hypothetical protein